MAGPCARPWPWTADMVVLVHCTALHRTVAYSTVEWRKNAFGLAPHVVHDDMWPGNDICSILQTRLACM